MSKQNQYYSERNDSPDNEFYRDQTCQGTGSVDIFRPNLSEVATDQATTPSNAASDYYSRDIGDDQWHPVAHNHDNYDAPPNESWDNDSTGSPDQQFDDYFSQDAERGFNLLFDPTLPETNSAVEDHYDNHDRRDPSFYLPSDEPALMGTVNNQNRTSGIQVFADDLLDYPRKLGGIQIPKSLVVIVTVCFLVAMGTALFHFSKPDVSAYEIVQMDSYDGIQEAPAIFNLTNLDSCASPSDCIRQSLNASKADIAKYTQETIAIREIPANDSVQVQESRTISLNTAVLVTAENVSPDSLRVLAQWSNVRDTPDLSGAIVTSLAKGTLVTVISSNGSWYKIQADPDPQKHGFMHQSTVEPVLY